MTSRNMGQIKPSPKLSPVALRNLALRRQQLANSKTTFDVPKPKSQQHQKLHQGQGQKTKSRQTSIQTKLGFALGITGVLSLLGLAVAIAIVDQNLRTQLIAQSKSELSVVATNYNIKVNQMAFGSRGQSENTAIIAAAAANKSNPTVKAILANEATVRDIEFVTLVNPNKQIIDSANSSRIGSEFDPSGLVTQALSTGKQTISSEVITYEDLAAENSQLAERLGKSAADTPNFLVRYVVTPVRSSDRQLLGALVFGDVIAQPKIAIADRTNQTLENGLTLITVKAAPILGQVRQEGQVRLLSSFSADLINKALNPVNKTTIASWQASGGATFSHLVPNALVSQDAVIDGQTFTLTASPILNATGKPVGVMLRGTSHKQLNSLLSQAALLIVGFGAFLAVVGSLVSVAIGRSISKPIKKLEDVAREYAQGNLSAKAEVKSMDEVGVLATVFNQMADSISQRETEQIELQSETSLQNLLMQEEVAQLLDVVSDLEMGDLTVQAKVSDRETGLIADTLNRLIEQLGEVMSAVLQTAHQVNQGAELLETQAIAVAQNAQQQAKSVVEVREGIDNMNQQAQKASLQAVSTNKTVQTAQIAVTKGQQEIASLLASINSLQAGTVQMVKRIKNLGEFVDLAKQFVLDQKRLASLTQVLAMNASMVAARALEQREPDQFASVAKEFEAIANQVNNLATQTNQGLIVLQQRTGFVEVVVSGIDQDVRDVSGLVEEFTNSIELSSQSFNNIKSATEQVAEIGRSVMESSNSIAKAVKLSLSSIQTIEAVAERSASQARFTREQSGKMGELARQLLEKVQFFRLPQQLQTQPSDRRLESVDTQFIPINYLDQKVENEYTTLEDVSLLTGRNSN
ncbi:methyl-accepting chemotaxis protein [Tumidithrix elongata RA019]|uniref:Methyl-accepting chemotaxis protein n=1 Tax=Tumidithrix elongata BACA0141 TaxID=2716417 RepID=A0AAW9PQR4_9CYAN|nr:methyl-accepting chemotaxis protein [Tumidithrix elongata RA019]